MRLASLGINYPIAALNEQDNNMTKQDTTTATDIKSASSAAPGRWGGHSLDCEARKPGGMLMAALMGCAMERGHNLVQLARQVGVTPGYLTQLRCGMRSVKTISDKFARSCARYLGLSTTKILMLSGRLAPSDFYESQRTFAEEVAMAMLRICQDVRWAHVITPQLRIADPDTQHAVVRLYEAATGTVLMPGRHDFDAVAM